MTYKQIIDEFFNICKDHKMINSWGYGAISDIVSPYNRDDSDYPYAFLNPTSHQLERGRLTVRFNLIMQELTADTDDGVIQGQSDCLQYIKDILAHYYFTLDKYDFTLNVTLTPFKERFDDVVCGMTANIELQLPDVLDDCIAPFHG